jgi:putative cardiolipin synthase
MLTVGPLVNEITNEFDIYFSNAYSVDFDYIEKSDKNYRVALDAKFDALRKDTGAEALHNALKNRKITKQFNAKQLPLYFGDAVLLYDMPQKVTTDVNDTSTHIQSMIPQEIRATERFYMVSPYFIPNEKMLVRLQKMLDKGIDVAVLTNSLESSDSAAVYAYYSLSQKKLLKMGVRLYEIHPYAFSDAVLNQEYNTLKDMPTAMLHAKTIVIDDDFFVIGSVNMDPRSRELNTELVSIIKSPELNAHEAKVFERMIAPENAYELGLEYNEDNSSKVVWKATINGEKKKFYNDGDSSTWLHIKKNLSLWFPVEDLL